MFIILWFIQLRISTEIIDWIYFVVGEKNPKMFLIDRILKLVID